MRDDSGIELRRDVEDLRGDVMMAALRQETWRGQRYPAVGSCVVLSRLGAGGMGTVYYGYQPRLQREVALKFLPLTSLHDETKRERFEREARVAARVTSPYLVSIYDVGDERGLLYMVMEYVHGCSAGGWSRLAKRGTLPPVTELEVLTLACAVSRGLTAAHARQVVHRDIKPDNIFIPLGEDGQLQFEAAKLGDLGLAVGHVDSSLTESFATMGSPGYMAPEQAYDAKRVGKPADVFSMGATMYALLAGQAPFCGESQMEIVMKTMQSSPTPITMLRPGLSASTVSLIEACLAREPEQRPPDAGTLERHLQGCLACVLGEPQGGWWQRWWRSWRCPGPSVPGTRCWRRFTCWRTSSCGPLRA